MSSESSNERRRDIRHRAFLAGKLYFNDRLNVVDCTIRDISDNGARLYIPQTVLIPDMVELHIPQKDQAWKALVTWRRGAEIGVEYQRGAPADDIEARFARLEAEIAQLKRIIRRAKLDTLPDADVA